MIILSLNNVRRIIFFIFTNILIILLIIPKNNGISKTLTIIPYGVIGIAVMVFFISAHFKQFKIFNVIWKLNYIDVMIMILPLLYYLLSLKSMYAENSLLAISEMWIILIIYNFSKICWIDEKFFKIFSIIITLLGSYLAIVTINKIHLWIWLFQKQQFIDIRDIRNTMPTVNSMPIGMWASVLLGFSALVLIISTIWKYNYPCNNLIIIFLELCFVIINIAIIATLSRGALFGLLSMLTLNLIGSVVVKEKMFLRVLKLYVINILLTIIVFFLMGIHPSIKKSVLLTSPTESQVRSVHGRIFIWKNNVELFKNYPIFGVGPKNYGLVNVAISGKTDKINYTGQSFNIFFQLLSECGLIGIIYFITTSVLILLKIIKIYKCSNNRVLKIITVSLISGLIGIFIRDLTYSSIFNIEISILIACIISLISVFENKYINTTATLT